MDKLWVGSLDVCVVVGRHMVDKLWVGSLDVALSRQISPG